MYLKLLIISQLLIILKINCENNKQQQPFVNLTYTAMCPEQCSNCQFIQNQDHEHEDRHQVHYYVNCVNADLTSLRNIIPNIQQAVTHLDLSYNQLTRLPKELLNLQYIEWLSLAHNQITDIDLSNKTIDALHKLKLKFLNMSSNSINNNNNLINNLLNNRTLPNLQYFDLNSNNFSNLLNENQNLDLRSDSLQILNLHNCSIHSMKNKYVFQNLRQLKVLILSKNNINWFNELFSNSIQSLDLSDCNLNHIRSNAFIKMPSLQTLYLNNNQFLQIYSTMGIQHPLSTTINKIFINNCKLTVNYINNIVNLTQLHMSNNILINELIAITFQKNIHLEIIDLSKCSINHIDYLTFYPLTNLTELHLSENRINYLHSETFLYNLKLSYLNLSRNHFKTLEPIQSISLKHLDLSYCELNIIERNTFKSLTALISLNLSNNYIEYLPDYLSINNLQYLDISYCRLLLITDYTFIEFNQLTKLKLSGNRFYQPFKETMLPDTLTSIALNDNPWRCDCYSLDLKYFYDYLNINDLTSESNLVCYSPTNLTGSTWNIACKKQWFRYNLINNFNHPNTNTIPHLERVWLFLIITFITLTVLFCVVSNARRLVTQRARREQVQMERLANEARERLRMIRDRQTMSLNNIAASTNAPDPRDLISPPSYEEALSMLRPSISDLRLKRPLSMLSTESTPNNMISMSMSHDQQSISVSSSASSLIVYQDNNPHDSRNNVQQSL